MKKPFPNNVYLIYCFVYLGEGVMMVTNYSTVFKVFIVCMPFGHGHRINREKINHSPKSVA